MLSVRPTGRGGGGWVDGYEGKERFVYLKWASHCWLPIQNFIFPQRKFFWFWVGGPWGVGPPDHPPHPGPPAYVDSSTATWVNNPGRPGGRAALSVPRGPSNRAANPPWDATQP